MFAQKCFIRCNNPIDMYDICLILYSFIGYKGVQNDSMKYVNKKIELYFGENKKNKLYHPIISVDGYKFSISCKDAKCLDGIDCGENEDLFFALAALRNDSDMRQWFICDYSNDENKYKVGDWHLSREIFFSNSDYYKATVEDIINKFK